MTAPMVPHRQGGPGCVWEPLGMAFDKDTCYCAKGRAARDEKMESVRPYKNGELTEATIFSIRKELESARQKHPEGATLAALLKHAGRLVGALIDEGLASGGTKSCASVKARYEAVQVVVVVVRLIEGA